MKVILIDDCLPSDRIDFVNGLVADYSHFSFYSRWDDVREEIESQPVVDDDNALSEYLVFFHDSLPESRMLKKILDDRAMANVSFSGSRQRIENHGFYVDMPRDQFYRCLPGFLAQGADYNDLAYFTRPVEEAAPVPSGIPEALVLPLDGGNLHDSIKQAMLTRLDYIMGGQVPLRPIILVGVKTVQEYVAEDYALSMPQHFSDILVTEGVYIVATDAEAGRLVGSGAARPLAPERFKTGFLDRVKINPLIGGNHTISNDWGAFLVSRFLGNEAVFENHRRKVFDTDRAYLMYLLLSAMPDDALSNLAAQHGNADTQDMPVRLPDSTGRRVLLIDDQDTVWADVVSALLPGADLTVWGKSAGEAHAGHTYTYRRYINDDESAFFLTDEALAQIDTAGDSYDLIMLDLRLGGAAEENIGADRSLSGISVLERLMKGNRGNQVIVLTSSNKAWNMQRALLKYKAVGYYIKESPMHLHRPEETRRNLELLIDNINLAFRRSQLRNVYKDIYSRDENAPGMLMLIERYRTGHDSIVSDLQTMDRQIAASFAMIQEASRMPDGDISYAYAFVALEQVFETIKDFSVDNPANGNTFSSLCSALDLDDDRCGGLREQIYKRNRFIHSDERLDFCLDDYVRLLGWVKYCINSMSQCLDDMDDSRYAASGTMNWHVGGNAWQVTLSDESRRYIENYYPDCPRFLKGETITQFARGEGLEADETMEVTVRVAIYSDFVKVLEIGGA